MVSEVNQKPRKHGVKHHQMPSYVVERRQPERKLVAFQAVELMFTGPLKFRTEEEKCSYLLIWVGQKGRDIHNTMMNIGN